MASIVNYNGGLKRIEFAYGPRQSRKTIRLGRVNAKVAASWLAKVDAMIADKLAGRPHDAEVSKWLGDLDESMLARLRAVGLADGVGLSQTTLGELLEKYFAAMMAKPATRLAYGHVRKNLLEYFGATKSVRAVTAADADNWRAWLVEHENLSPATVSRRTVAARTIWRKAVRWNIARRNPFEGIRAGHQSNESRKRFITRQVIDAIIEHTPSLEWRTIIALARYGGLRCPSEIYALRWSDIDWDRGTIRVPCPKLEYLDGHSYRLVPLFPELREHLLALFTESPEGAEYVISTCRQGAMNLRTQFERLIARAGLTPWPKLFHNLRASRESELMREYDLATVCKWIGNSPAVAAKHYAMSVDLDADFHRATGLKQAQQKAQQKAQQTPESSDGQAMTFTPSFNEKTPENGGLVNPCLLSLSADKSRGWALLDSNQ